MVRIHITIHAPTESDNLGQISFSIVSSPNLALRAAISLLQEKDYAIEMHF